MEKRIAPALSRSLLRAALLGGAVFGCGEGAQTYDDGADGLGGRRAPPVIVSSPVPLTTIALSPGASRCEELQLQADTQVDFASSALETRCTVDSDCQVQVMPHPSCSWGRREACAWQVAATSSLAALEAVFANMDSGICADMEDLGCPAVAAVDPCVSLEPVIAWCDNETCSVRLAVSCEEAYAPAWAAVEDLYDSADRSCDVDADCTLFTSGGVSCAPGPAARCDSQIAVNVDAVAMMEAALDYIDEQDCDGYAEQLCTAAIEPIDCPNVQSARCVERQCVALGGSD